MASKGRGKSIPLYSKVAGEVVNHPELTLLGVEPNTIDEDQYSASSEVPVSLIRLSSLEELMSYDGEEGADNEVVPSDNTEAYPMEDHSLTLDQLSAQETKREMFCNTCQTSFASREEQVEHYQLDWHRYNLKRKLKGLSHVNQEEFERVAGDLSSISGSESDSGHSGKEEEPRLSHAIPDLAQTPFIYFTTTDKNGQQVYAVYRSVLTRAKRGGASVEAIRDLKNDQVWILLMRSGGHFAGAVFNGHAVVAHKTFHRYTVRAKRGTAQSVRDAQGGGHTPKSAGATLRRYNEAALAQEIQDLISSWDSHVREATAIFIRTPKYSRDVFVGGGRAPFSKEDPRLRAIPFPTRRPTLSEVKRVHSQLACLYRVPLTVLISQEPPLKKSPKMKRMPSPRSSARKVITTDNDAIEEVGEPDIGREGVNLKSTSEVAIENENSGGERVNKKKKKRKTVQPKEVIPDVIQDLLRICRNPEDDVDNLIKQLHSMRLRPFASSAVVVNITTQSQDIDSESCDINVESNTHEAKIDDKVTNSKCPASAVADHPPQASSPNPLGMLNELWGGSTVLHVAAASGNVGIVSSLLLHGADPVVKDQSGKTPYLVSKDKPVRDSFRRFMASHSTAYDYDSAHIPSPLTQDMEKERREKLNEKKKAQKRVRRQREKEMKSVREEKKIASTQEQKKAELSDREKRAMAAEKRLASQLPSSTAIIRAGKCSHCDQSLAGVVPFERLTFKYCSMSCLKQHRDQTDSR